MRDTLQGSHGPRDRRVQRQNEEGIPGRSREHDQWHAQQILLGRVSAATGTTTTTTVCSFEMCKKVGKKQ